MQAQEEKNYKEMYIKITEEAINLLAAAQQECEEMYISADNENKEGE